MRFPDLAVVGWQRDGGEDRDDRHDDHHFNYGEAALGRFHFLSPLGKNSFPGPSIASRTRRMVGFAAPAAGPFRRSVRSTPPHCQLVHTRRMPPTPPAYNSPLAGAPPCVD